MDIKTFFNKCIDIIDHNHIFNNIFKIIVMSIMIFYDFLTLKYLYNIILNQAFSFASIILLIILLLACCLSFFIIFKKWDYKYIVMYFILIGLYF